jgi:hypothetical protein
LKELEIRSDGDVRNEWMASQFDVLEFAGQTVLVHFLVVTDASNPTVFFIDDVSLEICVAGACGGIFYPDADTYTDDGRI